MSQITSPPQGPSVTLDRQDLIVHEPAIKDVLRSFVDFKSYSLYFPPHDAPGEARPVYLKDEQKLLLPLTLNGRFLGTFIAKGVKASGMNKNVLPLLSKAADLCLENLLLAKACRTDPVTGLASRLSLVTAMEREIELIQACIMPGSASCLDGGEARGGFGLVLFDVDHFSGVNRGYGHLFGESVLMRLGQILAETAPEGAVCARLEGDVFAALLPGASAARCGEMAEKFRSAVAQTAFTYPVNGDRIRLTVTSGFALYPRDLHGGQLAAPEGEAARILTQKALKALHCAKDLGRDQVMSFSRVLREGGHVLERLPLSRLVVNLGQGVDAKEGQRFLVWSPPEGGRSLKTPGRASERVSGRYPSMVKGEIILMETREHVSFAEVLHLTDPNWSIEPGDRLLLAQEPEGLFAAETAMDAPLKLDRGSGLLSHTDFIRQLTQARQGQSVFTLALVSLPEPGPELGEERQPQRAAAPSEARVQELAMLCREHFGQEVLGGRYSTGILSFFIPGLDPLVLRERFSAFMDLAGTRLGVKLAVGLAGYPFLNFGKADVLENCRKALEHSRFVPGQALAVFDSTSLTISADRLFTVGDVYGAMEEYKLALLADETNELARNSLGICLARLGRMAQAKTEFEKVLTLEPKNVMALYNLGHACHRLGETVMARKAFQRCLKHNPKDFYSLLRLGRMAEESGRLTNAKKYYEQAATEPAGKGLSMRPLARVALGLGRASEAREFLHQALLFDPKDAFSLNMLARLYLDGGEDPAVAEALARQSAALRPDQKGFWKDLARALERQGKTEEARQALARA